MRRPIDWLAFVEIKNIRDSLLSGFPLGTIIALFYVAYIVFSFFKSSQFKCSILLLKFFIVVKRQTERQILCESVFFVGANCAGLWAGERTVPFSFRSPSLSLFSDSPHIFSLPNHQISLTRKASIVIFSFHIIAVHFPPNMRTYGPSSTKYSYFMEIVKIGNLRW